ncbi:site-specific integrase [Chryseolinea sp. H1M3-3]|uniref:tyrosine-type recombinase/integrase n=1 Tax=Chryseolinea sp. H1M3-3 TaxID=3034144 RepID=UPI0023ED43FF|nr:site-specific integrase [Chryseolinea sp. H1M3-3]
MQKVKTRLTTSELVLWQWSANGEEKHPIKIRITHERKSRYYPVEHNGRNLFLSDEEWKEIQDREKVVKNEKRKIRQTVDAIATAAQIAISNTTKNNRPFTWEKFENEFLVNDSHDGLLSLFAGHLESLRAENRIGTYKTYNNAYQAFTAFRKHKELSPFDLTTDLLKAFEAFLLKRNCGKTTIGIYARTLKVIYNIAADKNPTLLEKYPFARKQTDRNRYKIKTGSGHKGEALTVKQLQKFVSISIDPAVPEYEAKLLWLFSFYCHGMNMKDICLLKYKDIQGEAIRYVRAKTKDTEAIESIMEIPLTNRIREIVSEIGNPDKRPNSYVFTIIPNGLASTVKRRTSKDKTPEERIDEIVRQKIKMVNERLKSICEGDEREGIKLTTYWARHTFASLLKESGESVETIRELLGHSDIRTTESYLKRLDKDKKREVNERIESILKAS